ncbi:MAG: translocation/assembly module TamB domain-containing protein [Muribaculaceae bacterium]|nr:translocation/assembly module TamB domain-containing protein [Muribaculaceae bacterium]
MKKDDDKKTNITPEPPKASTEANTASSTEANTEGAPQPADAAQESATSTQRRKRRVSRWISVPLKVLAAIVIVIILIPVLLYVPPIQRRVKDLACSEVKKSTGMDISVDRLLLRFPIDISLDGVSVVEATGDTMVKAASVVADVRLLPLLKLDIDVKKLSLRDGYYRMVSPDSSMIMKIRAARLDVAPGSKVEIAKSNILLDKATLGNADVELYMNVWRQQSTPKDSTSTPFYIALNELDGSDIRFGMSMLPTIDTLTLDVKKIRLHNGIIDLRTNNITASLLDIDGGAARYIAPTPEYVKAHPAPAPDPDAPASAPITIKGDSIAVSNFAAIYAIKGVTPAAGFDPSYVEVSDVGVGLRGFYNRASSLRLPITRLAARERSGLQIRRGAGLIALDESGIKIDGVDIRTAYSSIAATADLPFALMELRPEAPVDARINASLGMPDINAFMPAAKAYTAALASTVLDARLEASGRLDNVDVSRLDLTLPSILTLHAKGQAANALDIKKLRARLDLSGEVWNPGPIERIIGPLPFSVPELTLRGTATADCMDYTADFTLLTSDGDVAGHGSVGLNNERYNADIDVSRLNVGKFMPDAGIGLLTASVSAQGAGFNPTLPGASTEADIHISSIEYNKRTLSDIHLRASLSEHNYEVAIDSPNPDFNLNGHITGSLSPDEYCASGDLRLYDLDLQALGLSEDVNNGSADLEFDVTARPAEWLYDATIDCSSIIWYLPTDDINLPGGLRAQFVAEAESVAAQLQADGVEVDFNSPTGLKNVVDGFSRAATTAMSQIEARNLDIEEMQALMPRFRLDGTVRGNGILSELLRSSGMTVDSIGFRLQNDSIISGGLQAMNLNTGSFALDTVRFGLRERGKLIDYRLHTGNRPGNGFDEFAQVNLNGYLGSNRLSAFLTQRNSAGHTGYRFGFTAAVGADSTVSLHFTPLNATIAYMPWKFNDDNLIDYRFTDRHVTANLQASSNESSILLMTEPLGDGKGEDLHLNVKNIHIEDFLKMSMLAPPLAATLNGDVRLNYDGKALNGKGDISVAGLKYDNMSVGDFDLGLNAGLNFSGATEAEVALKIDGKPAMSLSTVLEDKGSGLEPTTVDLALTQFPLKVANAFLGPDVARLSGSLNGTMTMTGSLTSPMLNGSMECDSVGVYIPMIGSSLTFDKAPLSVADNVVAFNNFSIYGANANPLVINGGVDAADFNAIKFDLTAKANNFQLINNSAKTGSDLYGKLFLTLTAGVKGPASHFDINADVNVLGTSDFTYQVPMTAANQLSGTSTEDVVKFVNFSDTTQVAKADSVARAMAMRITAKATISPGTVVSVVIPNSASGGGKVQLNPSGTLNYFQNFMGDMTLNGELTLGNGYAKYKLPVLGDKTFVFDPASYVLFNGNIMNPTLSVMATDHVKASVVNASGNSSMVNFLVKLSVSNTLENPKVVFDLSTDDDLTLQNELQSMSADQRSTQAMNLLITGRYQGSGLKTMTGNVGENMLYSLVESSLNSLASKYVKGVDLSFGIDQYDTATNGQQGSTTSYSYQLSKSLFSNRFKIVVGGNYSTDSSADENLTQNLISDISFEYILKQTSSLTMLVRLFRHVGYENILEGEVTSTGVGFTMRRRISDLRKLFTIHWGHPKPIEETPDSTAVEPRDATTDALRRAAQADPLKSDSVSSDSATSPDVESRD